MCFRKTLLQRFKDRVQYLFIRPKNRWSLSLLNVTQFSAVLNDNIYKLTLIFFLIRLKGEQQASVVTATAGAIYVIPFLLFSPVAGLIADRFSKQRLLILMKLAEVSILALAIISFSLKSILGGYGLLFLLSTHSALFGPAKYGIIPEIVPKDMVGPANGSITSFTYLAIIFGTFLASLLTEITGQNYVLILLTCVSIALLGFTTSLYIPKTPAQNSKTKLTNFFIHEIINTWRFAKNIPHLNTAMLGSAYFLFVGGFTQINIIPFAIQALHLSDIAGGYLFLATALGIALGALIAGKASRVRAELGTSCIAGFVMSACTLLLGLAPHNVLVNIGILVLLGIGGGIFIVPFDTYQQIASPDEKRGQVIATANFLSFFGVLIASLLLFLFSQVLDLRADTGFTIIGVLTLLFTLFLVFSLSDLLIHFLSRKWTKWNKIELNETSCITGEQKCIILTRGLSWRELVPVLSLSPNIHLLYPQEKLSCKTFFLKMFGSVDFISSQVDTEDLEEVIKYLHQKKKIPLLAFDRETEWKAFFLPDDCAHLLKSLDISLFFTKRSKQAISFEKSSQH